MNRVTGGIQRRLSQFFTMVSSVSALLCTAAVAGHLPSLPEPVTNNAVASVNLAGKQHVFSFMGLAEGKTYKDVHNRAWQLVIDSGGNASAWQRIPDVPSSLTLEGRLASVAVGVDKHIYLFGGYTVAKDHTEISTPDVYRYNPQTQKYTSMASMPVPVDDAVALVYQSRYVYLISGWHNDGNVNLVQVYDTQNNQWFQASPFSGRPVFGHAGGIVNQTMVICDGVSVVPHKNRRRTFAAETACYKGTINPRDATKIDWQILPHPTGEARYRMAASGHNDHGHIVFAGGSTNPYNYNGIGYNGEPSEPDNAIWAFDTEQNQWTVTTSNNYTMDHRGLIKTKAGWITVGGMHQHQTVTDTVTVYPLTDAPSAVD